MVLAHTPAPPKTPAKIKEILDEGLIANEGSLAKRIRLEKLNKFASIEQARDMLFNIKTVGVRP